MILLLLIRLEFPDVALEENNIAQPKTDKWSSFSLHL